MYLSPKNIQFIIENWNQQTIQYLTCPIDIKIHYTIKSISDNLSHRFIVRPFKLPTIKKYIISGKIKINTSQQ
jgi:hypothetical protein